MIYVLSDEPKDLSLRWLTIKLKEGSNIADVQTLSNIWSSLDNNTAFRYDWLNDLYNASYRNETLQMQLLNIFTLLAFIITIIGLVGLAVFTTEKRITEIAIRKVLGAKNSRLFLLLLNQFTILIVIANAIAIPFIYWKVSDWLNSFIYRIDFPITVFCIGFIISLAIAYLATLTVTYRAIAAKPVDALANN